MTLPAAAAPAAPAGPEAGPGFKFRVVTVTVPPAGHGESQAGDSERASETREESLGRERYREMERERA